MLKVITPLPAETVPLAQAAGRVSAGEVLSAVDLPRFDNSAMDGYAVRTSEAGAVAASGRTSMRLAGRRNSCS